MSNVMEFIKEEPWLFVTMPLVQLLTLAVLLYLLVIVLREISGVLKYIARLIYRFYQHRNKDINTSKKEDLCEKC